MSAPTLAHEARRDELELLATLAGIHVPTYLGIGLEPDVTRIDPRRRILFVGDAKETETPSSLSTRRRLARYAEAARPAAFSQAAVVFAIAHPSPPAGRRWSRLLLEVLEAAGLVPLSSSTCILDPHTTVTTERR